MLSYAQIIALYRSCEEEISNPNNIHQLIEKMLADEIVFTPHHLTEYLYLVPRPNKKLFLQKLIKLKYLHNDNLLYQRMSYEKKNFIFSSLKKMLLLF